MDPEKPINDCQGFRQGAGLNKNPNTTMHGIGYPLTLGADGTPRRRDRKASADTRPSLAIRTTMAITEVELDIELVIKIYRNLLHHPGTAPADLWELR